MLGAAYLYYRYYAPGFLRIGLSNPETKIYIGETEYKADRLIALPPDTYFVRASLGENKLDALYEITIDPLKLTKLSVSLSNVNTIASLDVSYQPIGNYGIYNANSTEAIFYYDNKKIKSVNLKSADAKISDIANLDFISDEDIVTNIKWSPTGNRLALKILNSQDQEIFWTYSIDSKKYFKLSDKITNLAWSPDGNKIVYFFEDNETRSINIANPDGNGWIKVKDLQDFGKDIFWINNDLLAYTFQGANDDKTYLWQFRSDGNGINKIDFGSTQTFPSKIKFSADGNYIVYIMQSENDPGLYLQDVKNSTTKKISASTNKNFILLENEKKIIFIDTIEQTTSENNLDYKLIKYEIANANVKELASFGKSYSQSPDFITIFNNSIYFILDNFLYKAT